MGSINGQINGHILSLLATSVRDFAQLLESPYFLILAGMMLGFYLLHLMKGVVSAKALPFSSVSRPSPVAWTVPVILVSLVIVKVISVLR